MKKLFASIKTGIKSLIEKTSKSSKILKTLVAMQLKEKFNLKERKYTLGKKISTVVFAILKFALIVGLCFVALFICKYLSLFSLVNIIPTSVLTVIFTVMLLISVVSSTVALMKSLYYSYDNSVLLTLPCKPTQVYLSKLIVFYIYEFIKNMSFMVPMFFAFGIIHSFSLVYYFWTIFCFVFISMVPVVIGVLLSIPMMWFYNFFRQYKRLQAICLITLIAVFTIGVFNMINIIPTNIDLLGTWGTTFWSIQDFLNNFIVKFKAFNDIVLMVVGTRVNLINILFVGNTFATFFKLIVCIILLFVVGMLIVKPLFYKMASKPFEYRKEQRKIKNNVVTNKKVSSIKTQILLNLREPSRLFTSIIIMIAMPILVFFLNKMFGAMNTRMLGNNMTIAFNILIILLISLSSNYYASSVFSRDGRSSYLIKVQPSKYQPLLLSKLMFNTIFMVVSFIATLMVLIYSSSLGIANSIILILSAIFIYFAHLFYSAELDIMNPQFELYASIGNSDSNPNETKSTIIAFLGSFLTFGILFLLLMENNGVITYIKILLLSLIVMIFRIYMLLTKIKLYYKEK